MSSRTGVLIASVFFAAAAFYFRWYYLDFVSYDIQYFLRPWLDFIREHGVLHAYGQNFNNYAPLYPYMLGLANLAAPDSAPRYLIKAVSFIGDGLLAYYVWRLVLLRFPQQREKACCGALMLLALPAVIINSAIAAQSDAWYTAFLLAALCALIEKRHAAMLAWAGLAYAFKQQAMFLWPFFFIFVLNGQIRWQRLWIPLAVVLATFVPAWLEGRSLGELLWVYYMQAHYYPGLGNAANLYHYLGGYKEGHLQVASAMVIGFGICMTLAASIAYAYASARRTDFVSGPEIYVLLACMSATMVPFLLPKMLDRYFYTASVLAVILAIMNIRYIGVALCLQLAVWLTSPVLMMRELPPLVTGVNLHLSYDMRQLVAPVFTLIALALLLHACWQNIWGKPRPH